MSEVPLYGRPLGIAAASGSTEVVQLLLDARANIDGVLFFFCFITLQPRVELYTSSMSLKFEPSSEPFHISAK